MLPQYSGRVMWQIGQIHRGAVPDDDMVPPIRLALGRTIQIQRDTRSQTNSPELASW